MNASHSGLAELQMAGFETKQLKEGGFTALEFQLLGTISSELKKAGFSAAELRVGVGMCMRMCIVSPAFVPHQAQARVGGHACASACACASQGRRAQGGCGYVYAHVHRKPCIRTTPTSPPLTQLGP